MKANINSSRIIYFLPVVLIILLSACNKELIEPGPDPGIIELDSGLSLSGDALDRYKGDLGVLIDTRQLAQKNFSPQKAKITTTATKGNYNKEILIDPFTSLASLSIPIEDLSEDAAEELREGVGITVDILDDSGETIATQENNKISFKENGADFPIDGSDLSPKVASINFHPDVPHFLQIVSSDGTYSDQAVEKSASDEGERTTLYQDYSAFKDTWSNHQYYFQKHPGTNNVFSIYNRHHKRYLYIGDDNKTFRQSGTYTYPEDIVNLHPRYKFIIKQGKDGFYTLHDIRGNGLRKTLEGLKRVWKTSGSGAVQLFRIIGLNVAWEVEDLASKHFAPILPAAETSFGFNSTLVNCASGTLEQEVGIEKTETTRYTLSYEESISLASRVTSSTSASATATAEANFFGNKGSVSGTVETSLEVSVEATKSSTTGQSFTTEETNTYFSKRIVTVPSQKASLVYDAYQSYSNVRVPFVRRFRIKGNSTDSGDGLSGEQIRTQYFNSKSRGIVTETGSNYIEVAIRGVSVLDNILKTQSEVRDVPNKCD